MKTLQLATLTTLLCLCFSACTWLSYARRPCVDGGPHQWGQWRLNADGERLGVNGLPKQRRKCDICGITQEGY
ncbi:hypothetical protein HQ447_00060 [bacterium]|nr:hypothetical protein [bacterium]